jgi:hypothetical protein
MENILCISLLACKYINLINCFKGLDLEEIENRITPTTNKIFAKPGLTEVIEPSYFHRHGCSISADGFQMPYLRKYPSR